MDNKMSKGAIISLVVFAGIVLIIVAAIIAGAIKGHNQQNNQNTQASNIQSSNSAQLNSCLDSTDKWFTTNGTTNIEEIDLLSNKEEQVTECQSKYPITPSTAYQSQYNSCISSVDQWWTNEATTVGIADLMLPVKTQMVNECSVRYPTS